MGVLLEDSIALLHPGHVRSVHHEDEAMDLESESFYQSSKYVYMSTQIQLSVLTNLLKAKEPIASVRPNYDGLKSLE